MGEIVFASQIILPPYESSDIDFERHIAKVFAVAINTCNPDPLVSLFADNIEQHDQNILEPMIGREAVTEYFVERLEDIRVGPPEMATFAEMSEFRGRPCVTVAMKEKESLLFAVFFEFENHQITSINRCSVLPNPYMVERTGEYPIGLD